MNWPLKFQGRFVTEAQVNEILKLLRDNASWNRTRLSQELCEHWSWQGPDGQMKDIACRELLRKLEARALIQLPPRQNYSPRRPVTIESVDVDQTPVSCKLADMQPIKTVDARDCSEHENAFNYLLKAHHYLSYQRPVGQNMKYLIPGKDERILACFLAQRPGKQRFEIAGSAGRLTFANETWD